uniref:Ran-specific GTPase-activating protein n=1 Tax=Rhipicephalus zambeziensis TaxID=60191 RepID=A0A224YYL2_9ACAR
MKLPLIDVKTLEEDEEVLVKLRGKLYRYVTAPNEAPEWKERGTGEVKILCNKAGHCRILMRRDKTFKVCANHYVHPGMELKPSHGSDKAWVWSTLADFADEEPKPELLALRFGSVENAQKFKEKFEEAKKMQIELLKESKGGEFLPGCCLLYHLINVKVRLVCYSLFALNPAVQTVHDSLKFLKNCY